MYATGDKPICIIHIILKPQTDTNPGYLIVFKTNADIII